MIVRSAQLGAARSSQDRVCIGENAVVVLDGASGSDQERVSVENYVDALGSYLLTHLADGIRPLRDVVTAAISQTVAELGLAPGRSPSSTVAVVRHTRVTVDTLVLCDSPIYVATSKAVERVSDERLTRLPSQSRRAVLARLVNGAGFDDVHRQLLTDMQTEKAPKRNTPGGYWVAEAAPDAGQYAICKSYPASEVKWCALVTDGADEVMRHLGVDISDVAHYDDAGLAELLTLLHTWEAERDPDASLLPRFKVHDDKTIAIVHLGAPQ